MGLADGPRDDLGLPFNRAAGPIGEAHCSGGILVDSHTTAFGLEDKQPTRNRVPSDRVGALLSHDRLELLLVPRVENRDRPGRTDGDVDAMKIPVVRHDVWDTAERKARCNGAGSWIEHDELAGVGRAPERRPAPLADNGESMRSS